MIKTTLKESYHHKKEKNLNFKYFLFNSNRKAFVRMMEMKQKEKGSQNVEF